MPLTLNAFHLEPMRQNVLQTPQISMEINSLEKSIAVLQNSIDNYEKQEKDKTNSTDQLQTTATSTKCTLDIENTNEDPQTRAFVHPRRTSDFYATHGKLPKRFEEPDTWNYKINQQNPLYTTTTNQYGLQRPTVHEMPTEFHGQTAEFSEHLSMAGPYRNFSLNT
ncbi:hypothetical protein BSLG_010071 [Batrachochytrium salamandrivorans]|nr:hypothetical protein BASA62_006392 [Batrachochytrium salamandrivorans]KAJ1328339.1 hypothetical protein BSLG_010071 [Batrachochytrium salamandrivorans]